MWSEKKYSKKYSSPLETYSHVGTFHVLRTFTLAGDLFTKMFLESCEKISLLWGKKCMVFSVVNNIKDIVLDCFLFKNIKHFSVKKIVSLFLVPVAPHNSYKLSWFLLWVFENVLCQTLLLQLLVHWKCNKQSQRQKHQINPYTLTVRMVLLQTN